MLVQESGFSRARFVPSRNCESRILIDLDETEGGYQHLLVFHNARLKFPNKLSPPRASRIVLHIHLTCIHLPFPIQIFHTSFMFARLSQVSRHLSRPLESYAQSSVSTSRSLLGGNIMTSVMSAGEKSKRMIHTAGCIIIGDEVLGGKVRSAERLAARHSPS
jgi:hypothetical protein